jgi:hypothetical protein
MRADPANAPPSMHTRLAGLRDGEVSVGLACGASPRAVASAIEDPRGGAKGIMRCANSEDTSHRMWGTRDRLACDRDETTVPVDDDDDIDLEPPGDRFELRRIAVDDAPPPAGKRRPIEVALDGVYGTDHDRDGRHRTGGEPSLTLSRRELSHGYRHVSRCRCQARPLGVDVRPTPSCQRAGDEMTRRPT